MTVGGYKSVSFSWQGGRTDTPSDRTKFVLNGICDAIISANVGWQYDTLTPTSADFVQMPANNSAQFPVWFKVLKKELDSHVYRLGLGYVYAATNYASSSSTNILKPSDCCNTRMSSTYESSQTGKFAPGLFFGFIKDGAFITDVTYGAVWDGNGEFTHLTPFCSQYPGSGQTCCAEDNATSKLYKYNFILKDAQIGIILRVSNWSNGRTKTFFTGEIFKDTGHSSDSIKIGTVCLYCPFEGESFDTTIATRFILSNSPAGSTVFPTNSNDFYLLSTVISSTNTAYAGDLHAASSGYVTYSPFIKFDVSVVSNDVSSTITSPGGRWTPCYMAVLAADHDTYGVVPGDGFKGYIDTDLLRGVNPNYGYGQQLDGGNFVYLGGGFAIGWDPNNTVLLF